MDCASCGRTNPTEARFCAGCGTSLAPRCPACGAECPADASFCIGCGAALAAHPADAVSRKILTIVFADLIGSMSLHERLDAESARRVMDRYHRAMSAAVDVHGGRVVQLLGDGVLAAFGVPRVAEDDAIRAVRAAVGMQRAFRELAREQGEAMQSVGLRVAVNTGEVVVSDDENSVMGDPTNVAARLQQEARDGDVIVGEGTQRLVGGLVTLAPLGSFALRGRAESVAAYRVVSLDRPASAQAIAFVGREDELRRLSAVYDAAVATPAARLAVLLGSPGLGKSRLVAEFTRRAGERATVLAARCDAAGGATFAPLAEALRALLRIDEGAGGDVLRAAIDAVVAGEDAERTRIATGIGALLAGTPAPPEETFFVVRRLLAALAAVRPVVLLIDDLQWAEPLLLDLVEHLVQWSTGVPLLVLVAARPELRETRSSLANPSALVADVVTLTGLDAGAATRLAANVIGGSELPAALAGRVLATSEGNPLFVSELVRMLVQDGTLVREGDRWITTVEVAKLDMPATIQVLLAARIERLRPEERSVLERAAVIGRQFSRAAVAHLLPRDAHDLDVQLEALRRSELIEPDTGWFLGEPALRFHHVLIRDAAYRRVLKETRAELHARLADWIVSRVGDAIEHDETIGWHLEQAHQHLRELGPLDESARSLGERAARHLGAAGQRSLARDDLPLAAGLLGRAIDRLDAADAARADLALDWCEALLSAGDVGPAVGAIAELGRFSGDSDRLRAWHTCFSGQLAVLTDPQSLRAAADAVAAAADALASLGDDAGEAKAHAVHAAALARLGKVGACEAALDRALAAARRAHDRRRANGVLAGAPLAALWGPSPVTRASGRCLDVVRVLRITQGAPAVEAVALSCQGVLEALRGRAEAARRMIASSRQMVEELGITHRLLEADVFAGRIELLEDAAVAAERCLRSAYDGLRDLGLGIDAARAAALLARALLAQGRAAEAEALSHESEALAGDDLQAAIAWRGVRAEALARRGDHAAAVEFASKAVEIAAATDALLDHADARVALAAALRAAGRSAEADTEEARAIELWEAKGATLLVDRARGRDRRAAPVERALEDRVESARPVHHRVRPNAASANADRAEAAIAARDADAWGSLFADDMEGVIHPSGATHDRQGVLADWRSLLKARDGTYRMESLATLGESLALCRLSVSASGVSGKKFGVGAYERQDLTLIEVGADGRRRRSEIFATDHLGDAVARLYERYAELLPDGPARVRAAATARSVAALPLAGPIDIDRWASVFAPDIEGVDPRTVGFGVLHGAEELLRTMRAFRALVEDPESHVEDVLDLRSDALLVRWTNSGTLGDGGGSFERTLLMLWAFGADGLLIRWEQLDVDRDAEALARFDELTAGAKAAPRRVRANAATAKVVRLDAAIAARDAGALPALFADEMQVVNHHLAGGEYDRQGALATWRSLLSAEAPTCRHEPLATLGDSLLLCRQFLSASGFAGGKLDVGAFEREEIVLIEVDGRGRGRRSELFAADRLGDAIARLYERCAELLPAGPERARAAATAHSVAALFGPPDRWPLAPDVEAVDHRTVGFGSLHGADAALHATRTLVELSDDFTCRVDDVLDLRCDALCVRWTTSGTVRASGGTFERSLCQLFFFGADGQVTRWEQFDTERDTEALGRFDALTAAPANLRPVRRRVRANAATASAARYDAAIAARDEAALADVYAEGAVSVHHATGTVYDRDAGIARSRAMFRAENSRFETRALATLGDSLALGRSLMSGGGLVSGSFDVGAYEHEAILLTEADAHGRRARLEHFEVDHLGDAVARLYTRYAELLPDGPERIRAAATARSAAAYLMQPWDPDRYAAAFAPAIEVVDHRILGTWSTLGVEAAVENIRSWLLLTDDGALREDDILCLQSDALLGCRTFFGTDRASGGAFERQFLQLWVFGSDGLLTRIEYFDADRDAEAFARFDELTAKALLARSVRRVRLNAATANAARQAAAVAARDVGALPALLADDIVVVNHANGVEHGREGVLFSFRSLLSDPEPSLRNEPLATLGDSLALCRWSLSASGRVDHNFDVGAWERDHFYLFEVDAQGRRARTEVFAVDHLGDAIARLYERYAELLPDGPERARADGNARVAAAWAGPFDPDRYATALAPDVEVVDHRILGTLSVRGAEAHIQNLRSWLDVADDITRRADEILALRPGALLARWTHLGTVRASGGAYERPFLLYWAVGSDGLVSRWELFDPERVAEALARFDELAAAPSRAAEKRERRVRANAATTHAALVDAAIADRDADALPALLADTSEVIDHTTGTTWDRPGFLATWHSLLRARDPTLRHEPLASLGDSLALCRVSTEASGFLGRTVDVGAYESEKIVLIEVDTQGRRRQSETFASDRLGDAVARLFERYAELLPDGPARTRAAATARSVAAALGPYDTDRYDTAHAATIEYFDHRTHGVGSLTGVDAVRHWFASLLEVAEGVANRCDDVLGLRSDALLLRRTNFGIVRASGGSYERFFLSLGVFGADGLMTRLELFEGDRDAEALARFDELTSEPPALRIETLATRTNLLVDELWRVRDWERFAALFGAEFHNSDRRRMVLLELDRDQYLESMRLFFAMTTNTTEVLATRGSRLALVRVQWKGSNDSVGPSEGEFVLVIEVDEQGGIAAMIHFDPDALDAAYAELDRRYDAGEAAPYALEALQRLAQGFASRDWEQLSSALTEGFVLEDHRLLGWGTRSRDEFVAQIRVMVELAPDVTLRIDHLAIDRSGMFNVARWVGSRDGGAFEIPIVGVALLGPDGLIRRIHTYDLDQLDAARACFDALTSEAPTPRIENAATRAAGRIGAAWEARDWKRLAGLYPAGFRCSDRKRMTQLELDRDQYLEWMRPLFEMSSSRLEQEVLATRGDRLALVRQRAEVADHNVGPSEIESLGVLEVDGDGELVATARFDADDHAAAHAALDARYAAGEGARPDPLRIPPNAASRASDRLQQARETRDWDAFGALCSPGFVMDDRRRSILLTGDRDTLIASQRLIASQGVSVARTLLATAGDRLALERRLWTGAADAPDLEVETLHLKEVDAEGRVVAIVTFDPDDRRAASAEMYDRFARSDASGNLPAGGIEYMRALRDRDLDRVRAQLPDDFFFHDHRRTGPGRLGSADEYVAFVAALFEQSPDVLIESLYTLAVEAHGIFDVGHLLGTRDGGDFESVFARIVLHQGDQTVGEELFEIEDLDVARARFEELRPDPTRIPPNAATRAHDRSAEAVDARDWNAIRALVGDEFRFEDRSRWALVSGDVEVWIASATFLGSESAARAARVLRGTVGDRIALHQVAWRGGSDAARFELDKVRITEVGAEGKLRTVILFDLDNRRAACAEAQARFVTGEAAAIGGQAPIAALVRAVGQHDWDALREALARDAAICDRRALAIMGEVDREQWVDSLRTLADLAPDMDWELFRVLAWNRHGRVGAGRLFGTTRDGGPFENAFIAVLLTRSDHVERYEFFDVGDADRALARFEELCSGSEAS